jgi:hypothetical protein
MCEHTEREHLHYSGSDWSQTIDHQVQVRMHDVDDMVIPAFRFIVIHDRQYK